MEATQLLSTRVDFGFIDSKPSPIFEDEGECESYYVKGEVSLYEGFPAELQQYAGVIDLSYAHDFRFFDKKAYGSHSPYQLYIWGTVTKGVYHGRECAWYQINSDVYYQDGRYAWQGSRGDRTLVVKLDESDHDWINVYEHGSVPNIDTSWVNSFATFSREKVNKVIDLANVDLGQLSLEAAEGIRTLNINSIAYIKDALEIGDLARSLIPDPSDIKAAKNFPERVKALKDAVSSFYLANHYGTKLTYLDTKEIAKGIDRLSPGDLTQTMSACTTKEVFHDRQSYVVGHRVTAEVYNVDARDRAIISSVNDAMDALYDQVARPLYEADMVPSLANIWDMIPLSFVVDWFWPIGEPLEELETKNYLKTLEVLKVFISSSVYWEYRDDITYEGGQAHIDLACKYYKRETSAELPTPPPFSMPSIQTPDFTKHWVEAAAIFL
jgi:hypothetical protein